MILTPWALGMSLISAIMVLMLLRAVIPAAVISIKGEKDDSRFQLEMEKQEVLGNAIMRLACIYYVVSPLILTAAAFDLGRQIPGAMCALGTFNAGSYGFLLIFIRLSGVFLVLSWIAVYSLDMLTITTPFRDIRRKMIICLFFWVFGDAVIQALFFESLNPRVATSCCAVVFDVGGNFSGSPAGIFAKMPTPAVFFMISFVYTAIGFMSMAPSGGKAVRVYGLASPLFFFFGLAAMTSCISPYIYALPHHHCPFCILAGREGLIGIPLMLSLYIGTLCGWWAGIWDLASARSVPGKMTKTKTRKLFLVSAILNLLFVVGAMTVMGLYRVYGELL